MSTVPDTDAATARQVTVEIMSMVHGLGTLLMTGNITEAEAPGPGSGPRGSPPTRLTTTAVPS